MVLFFFCWFFFPGRELIPAARAAKPVRVGGLNHKRATFLPPETLCFVGEPLSLQLLLLWEMQKGEASARDGRRGRGATSAHSLALGPA